jgi:hypothetical protein
LLEDHAEFLRCLPHHQDSLAQVDAFGHGKRIAKSLNEFAPLLCVWVHLIKIGGGWFRNESMLGKAML